MRKNRHSLSEFQKIKQDCIYFAFTGKSTARVILPFGESDWMDWSSDKDDII